MSWCPLSCSPLPPFLLTHYSAPPPPSHIPILLYPSLSYPIFLRLSCPNSFSHTTVYRSSLDPFFFHFCSPFACKLQRTLLRLHHLSTGLCFLLSRSCSFPCFVSRCRWNPSRKTARPRYSCALFTHLLGDSVTQLLGGSVTRWLLFC